MFSFSFLSKQPVTQAEVDYSAEILPSIYQARDKLIIILQTILNMRFEKLMQPSSKEFIEFTRMKADANNIVRKIFNCIEKISYLHIAKVKPELAAALKSKIDEFISNVCSNIQYNKKTSYANEKIQGLENLQKENFEIIKRYCVDLAEEVEEIILTFAASISTFPIITKHRLKTIIKDYVDNNRDPHDFLFTLIIQFMGTQEFLECDDDNVICSKAFIKQLNQQAEDTLFEYYDVNMQKDKSNQTYLYQAIFSEITMSNSSELQHEEAESHEIERTLPGYQHRLFGDTISSHDAERPLLGKNYRQLPRVDRYFFSANDLIMLDQNTMAAVHGYGVEIFHFNHLQSGRYQVTSQKFMPYPGFNLVKISDQVLASISGQKIHIVNWQTGECQFVIDIPMQHRARIMSIAATKTHLIIQTVAGRLYFLNLNSKECKFTDKSISTLGEQILVSEDDKVILIERDKVLSSTKKSKISVYDSELKLLKQIKPGTYCLLPQNRLAVMKFEKAKQRCVLDIFNLSDLNERKTSHHFENVLAGPELIISLSDETILSMNLSRDESAQFKIWDIATQKIVKEWILKDTGRGLPKFIALPNRDVLVHFPKHGYITVNFPTVKNQPELDKDRKLFHNT